MVLIKCQQCGAGLHWDGEGYILRCVYCGMEYLMHPRKEPKAAKRIDPYVGRGEVQGIPIVQGTDCSGLCFIQSFAPKGWKVCARQATTKLYGDQMGNPYVVEGEYLSPDGASKIVFRGPNLYTDRKLSRVPLIDQVDVLGSFLRIGSPFQAEQYCDYLFQRDLNPGYPQKIKVETADSQERERQRQVQAQWQNQGFTRFQSEWKRITYAFIGQNGQRMRASVETRVNDGYRPLPQIFGGMLGGFMGQAFPQEEHMWETQYEFYLVAEERRFEELLPVRDKINSTLRGTKEFDEVRATMVQYMEGLRNQTMMNIQQQNQAHWDRMNAIIQDTNVYTTNVMREMNANTAATNERVNRLRSESIRGVNSYYTSNPGYGNPSVVEASVKYDHVYQSLRDPNVFVGSEEVWLEPGVDFEELKQTKGNY